MIRPYFRGTFAVLSRYLTVLPRVYVRGFTSRISLVAACLILQSRELKMASRHLAHHIAGHFAGRLSSFEYWVAVDRARLAIGSCSLDAKTAAVTFLSAVNRTRVPATPIRGYFGFLAPYLDRPFFRSATPDVSRLPRTV